MDISHFNGLLDISGSNLVGVGAGAVSSGEIKAAFTTQKWRPPQPVKGKWPVPGARLAMLDRMSKSKDEGSSDISEPEDEPKTDTSKDKVSNECSSNDKSGAKTVDDTSTSKDKKATSVAVMTMMVPKLKMTPHAVMTMVVPKLKMTPHAVMTKMVPKLKHARSIQSVL